jgi:hypothetical protein
MLCQEESTCKAANDLGLCKVVAWRHASPNLRKKPGAASDTPSQRGLHKLAPAASLPILIQVRVNTPEREIETRHRVTADLRPDLVGGRRVVCAFSFSEYPIMRYRQKELRASLPYFWIAGANPGAFVPECWFTKAVTSAGVGIEDCAPCRVTETAAATEAKTALCATGKPRINDTANPALKASPAKRCPFQTFQLMKRQHLLFPVCNCQPLKRLCRMYWSGLRAESTLAWARCSPVTILNSGERRPDRIPFLQFGREKNFLRRRTHPIDSLQ